MDVDLNEHVHYEGSKNEVRHTHAWAATSHHHILRAICNKEECEGQETHNIHSSKEEWHNRIRKDTAAAMYPDNVLRSPGDTQQR